jgi:hypothetical protein
LKKELKFNVFYGTEDFAKLFDNLIEDKIKNVAENVDNIVYNLSDKCYSSSTKEVDVDE